MPFFPLKYLKYTQIEYQPPTQELRGLAKNESRTSFVKAKPHRQAST